MASTDIVETGHAAADMAHGAESSAGMPQLDFSTFPNQIFWLIVSLLAIYFVLSRIALPRISKVLAERSNVISNDIAKAEDLKLKAEEAEASYQKALVDARTEAQEIILLSKADIQDELDVALKKADAEIAAKSSESEIKIHEINASALKSIREVANTTAAEIVKVTSPAKADAKVIKAAVDAAMKG